MCGSRARAAARGPVRKPFARSRPRAFPGRRPMSRRGMSTATDSERARSFVRILAQRSIASRPPARCQGAVVSALALDLALTGSRDWARRRSPAVTADLTVRPGRGADGGASGSHRVLCVPRGELAQRPECLSPAPRAPRLRPRSVPGVAGRRRPRGTAPASRRTSRSAGRRRPRVPRLRPAQRPGLPAVGVAGVAPACRPSAFACGRRRAPRRGLILAPSRPSANTNAPRRPVISAAPTPASAAPSCRRGDDIARLPA